MNTGYLFPNDNIINQILASAVTTCYGDIAKDSHRNLGSAMPSIPAKLPSCQWSSG